MEDQVSQSESTTIRLAEYQALRAEILNRFNIQHQLFALAIIAAGTIFVASVQNPNPTVGAILILGYPVLALFLAAGWGHQDRRVWQAATYIRERIEPALGTERMGWEHFHPPSRTGPGLYLLASRGIFLGTEIFAIVVGASLARIDLIASAALSGEAIPVNAVGVVALLIVAVVSVPFTFFVLRRIS
ncbi:MAG TPA: hypothetical protein VIG30_03895 [Ktedonobacterales bacterium]|jgi:hypothetical protein